MGSQVNKIHSSLTESYKLLKVDMGILEDEIVDYWWSYFVGITDAPRGSAYYCPFGKNRIISRVGSDEDNNLLINSSLRGILIHKLTHARQLEKFGLISF